jgi:CDP-4-dehydro-6-deoxyglucose reductase, E1
MINLIKSSFYNETETKNALAGFIVRSKIFSMNKQCAEFERQFAKKQKRKYAVFVSSGSSANLILIQSLLNLGLLKKGDAVGVSVLTWSTNVMPLIQLGLNPVAIDCSLNTLNTSPEELNKYVGKIKGLFLTNVLGFCDNISEIKKICRQNKIIFIEDNCESLGSQAGGKLLGNFGIASTFSFFVGHHLSSIEGGMVCTDDEKLRDALVMARAHGWDRNLSVDKQKRLRRQNKIDDFHAKYAFYDLAYNTRPNEISGFIGNRTIKYWKSIINKRFDNYKKFQQAIEANTDFMPLKITCMDIISNFAMPVICKNIKIFKKYHDKFSKANVEIRPVIAGNITKQPFYKKYVNIKRKYPNADIVHANGFYFGNNPEMTDKEIKLLCNLLK